MTEALRRAPWVPAADGPDLVPARALVLDTGADPADGLLRALAGAVPDLAGAVVGGPRDAPALAVLGVTRLGAAALADRLAGLRRPPSWWHALYAALAATPAVVADRQELAALPVPLADGRLVPGPRGTLLPDPGLADVLGDDTLPGLRVVDPAAVHPLLETLGARRADAASLLGEPELREAVARSVDDAEAGLAVAGLAGLVLRLLAEAGEAGADPGWGALALPDSEGGYRRADELVLPDGVLRTVLGEDSPVGVLAESAATAHARSALLAAGVLDGFAVVRDDAPTGPDHDLDDEETWWAEEVDPAAGWDAEEPAAPLSAMVAVRDLDLVADDRWDAAWTLLAADRSVRSALVALPGEPVPYTAWWLARHGRLAGHAPGHWRLPGEAPGLPVVGADPGRAAALAALYDPVPGPAVPDVGFLAAVGVRTDLRIDGADDATDLLVRLADPARSVPAGAVLAAHTVLAEAVDARRIAVADVEPPPRVRTAAGRVVDADPDRGAVPAVLDRPWLLAGLRPGRRGPRRRPRRVHPRRPARPPARRGRAPRRGPLAGRRHPVDGPAGRRGVGRRRGTRPAGGGGRPARAPAGRGRRRRPRPAAARGLPRGVGGRRGRAHRRPGARPARRLGPHRALSASRGARGVRASARPGPRARWRAAAG